MKISDTVYTFAVGAVLTIGVEAMLLGLGAAFQVLLFGGFPR